jgi:hypothetical protein
VLNRLDGVRSPRGNFARYEASQIFGDLLVTAVAQALTHDEQRTKGCVVVAIATSSNVKLLNRSASRAQMPDEGVLLFPRYHLVIGIG